MNMIIKNLMVFLFVFAIEFSYAQPNHQHLLYSHPLTDALPRYGENIENDAGVFLAGNGWQASTQNSQLTIELAERLPFEGTFKINVTNFDPPNQNIPDTKQHIINMYSRIYDNNKDIFTTDGSWWNIRTGTAYSAGEGMAGFKLLAAPRGLDSRDEIRCIESATWDPSEVHEFSVIWTTTEIFCYLDGSFITSLGFHGQIEAFKYILIGMDNLIYGYCAQPGPIYSNLRIYGPGEPVSADNQAPVVQCASLVTNTLFKVLFNEAVDENSATDLNNYTITPTLEIHEAILGDDLKTVELTTSPHTLDEAYNLHIENVADTSANHNTIDTTIVYEFQTELYVSNLSRENYYVTRKAVGDSIYSDRNYRILSISEALTDFDWIVTANEDKQNFDDTFLIFYINKSALMTIGYDKGMDSIPDWLSDWQLTEHTIVSDDTEYACYQKRVTPCEIILGGNCGSSSSSMYLILINDEIDNIPPAPPTNLRIVRF